MFRRVGVAISGGVDSAVAALLLKQKGFSVSGVYMQNWDVVDEVGHCTGVNELDHAKLVCNRLQIPFHQVNFVPEYWNYVFVDFVSDYLKGLTPNPDVLCNKFIKFDSLLTYITGKLGLDALATGHYANNSYGPFLELYQNTDNPRLLTCKDKRKDQTFFLSQISNEALKRTMFPLAGYCKDEVKEIARKNHLKIIADKKESQGICFIGDRRFQNFIADYVNSSPGNFIDIDSGKVVGSHYGIHQWTIGQRCRIGGLSQAYYIAKKTKEGEIYVASGHEHPAFYSSIIISSAPHWIHSEPEEVRGPNGLSCFMRFQHGKPLTKCNVKRITDKEFEVVLDKPLRALTPGQYSVFYRDNECLGSARIRETINSISKVKAESIATAI